MAYGVTVKVADLVTPAKVAEMVTVVDEITEFVVIEKLWESLAPAGTVTAAGTAAIAALELERATL